MVAFRFRVRYQRAGGHVHCRVFQATADGTWQKNGDLVFDVDAWVEAEPRLRSGGFEVLPDAIEGGDLYAVAKRVCHEFGLPWTDPRTSIKHLPPASTSGDHKRATAAAARPAPSSPTPAPTGLMTLDEAAAYLTVALGTLRNWTSEKRIEYVKVGRLLRFTKPALDRFIARQTVTTRRDD